MNEKKTLWIFGLSAAVIFSVMVVGAAWRQGWFLPRADFTVRFPTANGLFVGTPVLLTGLKIGEVKAVDLEDDGRVEVVISVLEKYASQLREDATANSERTFVIGEKIIALSPGSRDKPILKPGSELAGHESMELTDILSGGHLTKYFETFHVLMDQLQSLVNVASAKDTDLATLYTQMHRSLKGIEDLSKDVRSMRGEVFASKDTKLLLANLSKASGNMEKVMTELSYALPKLNGMSGEFEQTLPVLSKALQESVITLQAMQKSFFLRSGVEQVRAEQKEAEEKRSPASESKSESP